MSFYLTNPVHTRTQIAAWSKVPGHAAWLAVAADDGSVGLHDASGDPVSYGSFSGSICNVRGKAGAASLAWHPSSMLLAIGWQDGALSLRDTHTSQLKEDCKCHKAAITCLEWHPDGKVLAGGDAAGLLGLWKVDGQMRPVSLVSYGGEASQSISHIVFGPSPAGVQLYCAAATPTGTAVYSADDQGHKVKLYTVDSRLTSLFLYAPKHQLVGVCDAAQLYVHGCEDDGKWDVVVKMKLPTAPAQGDGSLQVAWAGEHVLAFGSERDGEVRMYNLHTEDNFVLHADAANKAVSAAKICAISYNQQTSVLAAATTSGRVVFWRHLTDGAAVLNSGPEDSEASWQPLQGLTVPGQPRGIIWGPTPRLLGLVCEDCVHACERNAVQRRQCGSLSAVQTGVSDVTVTSATGTNTRTAAPSFQVRGLNLTDNHLLLWSGKAAEVHVIGPSLLLSHASFPCTATSIAIDPTSLFCVDGRATKVEVLSLEGTLQQTLALEPADGLPVKVDVCGDTLAVLTTLHCLRLWHLERGQDPKPYGGGRPLDMGTAVTESIRCNCDGTKVSILSCAQPGSDSMQLFVYDIESNSTTSYPFAADARSPQLHSWDPQHPMLLACETTTSPASSNRAGVSDPSTSGRKIDRSSAAATVVEVATLFATPQDGLLLQDYQPLAAGQGLAGVAAPYLTVFRLPIDDSTATSAASTSGRHSVIERISMRSFAGMEGGGEASRKALLEFSYQMCIGNMDQASKAVKVIKSAALWENMARSALKTKRLDVVNFCLNNMEGAAAAQALRGSRGVDEPTAKLGMIAMHLGMAPEAEALFRECARYDLLNQLLQSMGQWQRAVEVAQQHDRIHLRTTHYRYAEHLEAAGDFAAAMLQYEKANVHRTEVPRMLHDAHRLDELDAYIQKSGDKELLRWWARYSESLGDFAAALRCYLAAEDHLSLVRLHCHQGNFREAAIVVDESGSAAAAFHLARQFEATEQVADAVRYFAKSQRSSHGARLAKRHGMDNDLVALAMQSSPLMMLETAEYFEDKGQLDKAVTLYQASGRTRRALDLCFAAQLFEQLEAIVEGLNAESDPKLLARCGDFFLEHGQFDKAVRLLVTGKQHVRALDLCMQHSIPVSEELAEAMTPDKAGEGGESREALLRRIAGILEQQGSFHLACKKFTQAGDRTRAMAALIKSGDTDKIVFFAGVSRQPETYVMAANYLQTLDWHTRPDLMKHIVTFYTKGRALDSLAAFYEACAQIEIDEYRDYGKALQAMNEALRCISKSRAHDSQRRAESLSRRTASLERFVGARQQLAIDPSAAIRACEELIAEASGQDNNQYEAAVRVGDVFALLIEYWDSQGSLKQAYQLLEKMRLRGIPLGPYIEQETVDRIYQAVGVAAPAHKPAQQAQRRQHSENSDDSFIEEDAIAFSDDDERQP